MTTTEPGDQATDEPPDDPGSSDAADPEDATGPTQGPAGREVVVPMRLYKTVTVVATLLAMVTIVGGFVLLDAATNRAQAPIDQIDPVTALAGLGLIVLGAGTYAFSTRFRAEGMGKSKADEGEDSSDG